MIEVVLIAIALVLVAACGAFVAAEFAFITADRGTVERAAAAGDKRAAGVLEAVTSLSTQLSAAQVGITVTNLLIGFLAQPAIADLIGDGVPRGVSLAIAIVLATGMTMVFGELVPKNLAIARPLATAKAVQGFQRGFTTVAGPAIRGLNDVANAILRRIGVEPQEELASARSAEELGSLVGRSAEEGTLARETATLLQRSLAFGDRRAGDVMTPRARMHAIQHDADVGAVLRVARATGRSRFPVIPGDNDRVVGFVHIKHAMGVEATRRGAVGVREVMVEPVLVPDTMELDSLLAELRRGGLQMAVVVDEFGTVAGLVTLEDLIEEIVGEVRDEHDPADDRAQRAEDGSWSLSGLLRPDEASRFTGLLLPEGEDYETLGGLVAERLGRMPQEGDAVELTVDDLEDERRTVRLTVTRLDDLRVDRLRLEAIA